MNFVKYTCAALLLTETGAIKMKLKQQLERLGKVGDQKDQYLLLENKAFSGFGKPFDLGDIMMA